MKTVLVLCTGNSARSQMAEAAVNALWGDEWTAVSAGTEPAAEVHPLAARVMDERRIPLTGARPKHLGEMDGRDFDLVVTVCDGAREGCPLWPGAGEVKHLSFPDPALAVGDEEARLAVFRRVRDDIIDRLGELLARL